MKLASSPVQHVSTFIVSITKHKGNDARYIWDNGLGLVTFQIGNEVVLSGLSDQRVIHLHKLLQTKNKSEINLSNKSILPSSAQ